jgi:hypothetical protein
MATRHNSRHNPRTMVQRRGGQAVRRRGLCSSVSIGYLRYTPTLTLWSKLNQVPWWLAASPSDTSAAEQVRSCASSVVCLSKPLCTCSWEWLPRELPEVTPDGDDAQRRNNDDENEATGSISKPSPTCTWEWLPDDLPEVTPNGDLPEVTTKVNSSTNKRKRESDQGEESCKGKRRMRLCR